MKTRLMVALVLLLSTGLLLPGGAAARAPAAVGPPPSELRVSYGFEAGLSPWTTGTDSYYHVAKMGLMTGEKTCSFIGTTNRYVRLISLAKTGADPSVSPAPVGTWMQVPLAVGGAGIRQVTVQWYARWSPEGQPNPQPLRDQPTIYVGTQAPVKLQSFAYAPGYLTWNWNVYRYQTFIKTIPGALRTPVYVALGWDHVADSLDVDCVSIAITYLPAQ